MGGKRPDDQVTQTLVRENHHRVAGKIEEHAYLYTD
jgi:hypothetical protein